MSSQILRVPTSSQRKKAKELIAEVSSHLSEQFEKIRKANTPPTSKSDRYEIAVAEFLEVLLEPVYSFRTKVQLIDYLLDCVDVFAAGYNEWDVVASYSNAFPRHILPDKSSHTVAFDSVAFTAQVAQLLDPRKLEADLKRYELLDKLKLSELRNNWITYASPYAVERPLKVLLYHKRKIADKTLATLLSSHPAGYDILVVVNTDELFASQNNPFAKLFNKGRPGFSHSTGDSLFYLWMNLIVGIRRYSYIDIARTTWNIRNAAQGFRMMEHS